RQRRNCNSWAAAYWERRHTLRLGSRSHWKEYGAGRVPPRSEDRMAGPKVLPLLKSVCEDARVTLGVNNALGPHYVRRFFDETPVPGQSTETVPHRDGQHPHTACIEFRTRLFQQSNALRLAATHPRARGSDHAGQDLREMGRITGQAPRIPFSGAILPDAQCSLSTRKIQPLPRTA